MALSGPARRCSTGTRSRVLLDDLRDERAASVPFPPGDTGFSLPRTTPLRRGTAASAARLLRALRPDLHAAAVPRQRRVHARTRAANHYITGLARLQLRMARRALPRPDRPDGRRAADDRRRLPPALAADHAAGVPPRAHRRLGRGDRAGDRALRSGSCSRARGGPLRVDPAPGAAGGDAARCSVSTRTVALPARSTRRGCSRRRWPSTRASTSCASSAGGASPWGRMQARGPQARHADLRGDRRAAREWEARHRHPQPAARRGGRGRQHA